MSFLFPQLSSRRCLTQLSGSFSRQLTNYSRRSLATHTNNLYPYPAQNNPTPHQIFHLPASASQADIKQRYYDLVKIHHPDAPGARELPPEVAQTRFHSITTAYDVLRGKRPGMSAEESAQAQERRSARDLGAAIWRARQRHKADLEFIADDRWKDRVIVGMVVVAVVGFVLQSTATRSQAISESHERARQHVLYSKAPRDGAERRRRDEASLSASLDENS